MSKNNWPKWATEEIVIESYNPEWPFIAVKLINELRDLYDFGEVDFEHIGSTAVPGLSAKPVIDLIAPVENFDHIDIITKALAINDWNLIPPELDNKTYRRTFVKVVNDKRYAHFHTVLSGSDELIRQVIFRDVLKQHPGMVQAYSKLKLDLANKYKDDRERYTDGKSDFIKAVLDKHLS